jgi:hypothetical protein
MRSIDKEKFTGLYQAKYGSLSDKAMADMQILLAMMVADEKLTDIRHAAYMLATVMHECNRTWAPIEEIGKGKGKPYGKTDPITGKKHYGRGYVQLTWPDNYKRLGKAIGVNLYREPEKALQYDVAYQIMSYGMRHGAFTGVMLKRYIHDDVCDYFNSRRIINITDHADVIAGYARSFESWLKECLL